MTIALCIERHSINKVKIEATYGNVYPEVDCSAMAISICKLPEEEQVKAVKKFVAPNAGDELIITGTKKNGRWTEFNLMYKWKFRFTVRSIWFHSLLNQMFLITALIYGEIPRLIGGLRDLTNGYAGMIHEFEHRDSRGKLIEFCLHEEAARFLIHFEYNYCDRFGKDSDKRQEFARFWIDYLWSINKLEWLTPMSLAMLSTRIPDHTKIIIAEAIAPRAWIFPNVSEWKVYKQWLETGCPEFTLGDQSVTDGILAIMIHQQRNRHLMTPGILMTPLLDHTFPPEMIIDVLALFTTGDHGMTINNEAVGYDIW